MQGLELQQNLARAQHKRFVYSGCKTGLVVKTRLLFVQGAALGEEFGDGEPTDGEEPVQAEGRGLESTADSWKNEGLLKGFQFRPQ